MKIMCNCWWNTKLSNLFLWILSNIFLTFWVKIFRVKLSLSPRKNKVWEILFAFLFIKSHKIHIYIFKNEILAITNISVSREVLHMCPSWREVVHLLKKLLQAFVLMMSQAKVFRFSGFNDLLIKYSRII